MRKSSSVLLFPAFFLLAVTPVAGAAQGQSNGQQSDAGTAPLGAITEADRLFNFSATRVSVAPDIDGIIDEEVWSRAVVLSGFVQEEPDEGQPVSERTEVRVIYDDAAIYIAATNYDSQPDRIIANVRRRDESPHNNDSFLVTLDTYHDHRNGFLFATNPLGVRYDAQIVGEGSGAFGGRFPSQSLNRDWDAIWETRARITEEGWMVEIAIPFSELRFNIDRSDWGINFRRIIRRKTETAYWAPVERQFDETRLSSSGMVQGLQLSQPRNLQVRPYVVGGFNRKLADGPSYVYEYEDDYIGDIGGDVKWSVSPNLTLDLTVNTDFSQVEADNQRINLTRFSLFFPEKRDFFLENAGFFSFGGGSSGRGGSRMGGGSTVQGFHSRTIGINANNQQVPLYGGGRLTGKVGKWSIGTLIMQSGSLESAAGSEVSPSNNYIVGRASYDVGERSRAGVLFTNRQASSTDYNRELGFDGRWGINDQTTVDAWIMKTESPHLDGDDFAGQIQFDWGSPRFQVRGAYLDVGDNFNPEMGFVTRTGIRAIDSSFYWTPFFPDSRYVRNLSPHVMYRHTIDRSGELLSKYAHLDWDMFLRYGDKVSVAHNRSYELLELPFQISAGVIIPPGVYEWSEVNLEFQSDAGRSVDGSFNYTTGGFWSGDRSEIRVQAGWRPGSRLSFALSLNHNEIDLPEGAFETDLASLRADLDFTTEMSMRSLIQYNSQQDMMLANVRLRYIYTPGSDLYLVYNETQVVEGSGLVDRAVLFKATYLLRF